MRPFTDLQTLISREITENAQLGAIRGYNRMMVDEFNKISPLRGKTFLDLGASIHGYAMEAAMEHGIALYEGIDLDIVRHWQLPVVEFSTVDAHIGRLRQMNAEQLEYADGSFDCLLSISTFEHFHHPDAVLNEMFRVLRPGGIALINFEPIWTASYGHHLHHFGSVSDLVPPWSHLFLSEEQMRAVLARQTWPADAPIDLSGVLQWIYHGGGINRFSIHQQKTFFQASSFIIEWICPLPEDTVKRTEIAHYLSQVIPYTPDELLTRGLSLLMRKPE